MDSVVRDGDILNEINKKISTLILPSNIAEISDFAVAWNTRLKSIFFNEGLKQIGSHSFIGCKNVKSITFPTSLTSIKDFAFSSCKSLKEVELPSKLKEISNSSFSDCTSLKRVILPQNLETISYMAFYNCKSLYDIDIPKSVKEIGVSSFENCKSLTSIELPNEINNISSKTFYKCNMLEKVSLPNNLKTIDAMAFANCWALKEINIPDKVYSLGEAAFINNICLKQVKLPSALLELPKYTFKSCNSLENITIPNKVTRIGNECFEYCFNLKRIDLGDNIYLIDKSAFYLCKKLKNVTFPKFLKKINDEAFYGCDLYEVIIPEGVQYIGYGAFKENYNIEKISLPKDVEIDPNTFERLRHLKELSLFNMNNLLDSSIRSFVKKNNKQIYFNDKTGQLLIYKNDFEEEVNSDFKKVDFSKCKEYFNCSDELALILYLTLKNRKYNEFKFLKTFINYLGDQENLEILYKVINESNNSREYNGLIKRIYNNEIDKSEEYFNLYKFAIALGAFDNDSIVRQRACNFIENLFDKNILNINKCNELFSFLSFEEYNSEWAKFIMSNNNFIRLIEDNKNISNFFARTFNEFDGIKELNRKSKGNCKYRNVTVEACEKYLNKIPFVNVTADTLDIVPYLYTYTRDQETFEKAKNIRKQYLEKRKNGEIDDHILKEELKETSYFEEIEALKDKILNDSSKTIENLNAIANKKFTYEFLSKYDPKNFVLGKYCTCCSTLEGVGYGIMKASILHPDCQNLVIKDKTGKIIAKSTLYVNREQGYAVCNNVEVSVYVMDKEKAKIFLKYKQAIKDFVTKYNSKYKDNPIKQVNVGLDNNDLSLQIRKHSYKGEILQAIDFSEYGDIGKTYRGDWYNEQCVIWRDR